MLNCFFLREIQHELLLQQLVNIAALYVRNVCIDHEGNEIENEICTLPEDTKCCKAKIREACVVLGVHAPHAVNHLIANLHRWWVQFRIMPKDVAKVDMEEMA